MKQIKDFVEGDHITTNLLICSLDRCVANNGKPYLNITLQDSSKTINAKLWDIKNELEKELSVGKVYNFSLEINTYRNQLQAKIINVLPVSLKDINMEDYMIKSPIDKETLRNNILDAVNLIKNENLAKIVSNLLDYYSNDVFEYPAAAKIHHNFIGGLATHISGMVKVAISLCEIYPEINKDYLLSGIIVHDLGKIEEFTSPAVVDYSAEGKLLGHISILDARLLQIGKELGLEDSEELLLLRHMVLSHHGQYEFGSPVRPETLEAEILNLIDNIDARTNTILKALSEIKEGEFTQKIFALDNRIFYKHK